MDTNVQPTETIQDFALIYIADRLPMGLKTMEELSLLDYLFNGSILAAYQEDHKTKRDLKTLYSEIGGTLLEVLEVTAVIDIEEGKLKNTPLRRFDLRFVEWQPYGSLTEDFWNNGSTSKTSVDLANAQCLRYHEQVKGFQLTRVVKESTSYITGYSHSPTPDTLKIINHLCRSKSQ